MAKILVVDDSGLSRRISRRALEQAGHQVIEAEDGMTALERYFLEKPDVVLLDVSMKEMNGIEVLKQLRQMDAQARVVIATADIQSSTRTMAAEAGARGFITKPLSGDQLIKAVSAAFEGDA